MFKRLSVLLVMFLPVMAMGQIQFTPEEREAQKKQRDSMRKLSNEYFDLVRKIEEAQADGDRAKVKELKTELDGMREGIQTRVNNMREIHPRLLEHVLEITSNISETEAEILEIISDPSFFEVERPYVIDSNRKMNHKPSRLL